MYFRGGREGGRGEVQWDIVTSWCGKSGVEDERLALWVRLRSDLNAAVRRKQMQLMATTDAPHWVADNQLLNL